MKAKTWIYRKLASQLDIILEYRNRFLLQDNISNGNIMIGEHSYGYPEIIWDKNVTAKIIVGKFCSIANNVRIFNGSNHRIDWVTTYPHRIMFNMDGKYKDGHPASKGDVIIGNDVWIGSHATILSGVKIGDGAVVAAHCVVVKDVPPYCIVAGNPGVVVKTRFTQVQIEKLLSIKWWDWPDQKIIESVHLLCSSNIDDFIKKYTTV